MDIVEKLQAEEVKPITLDDIMPAQIVAEIHNPRTGRTLKVPFYTLSWEEWDMLGAQVKDPEIPKTRLADDDITLLPNPRDSRYLEQLALAQEDRKARRVMKCLEKGGNKFPGETALEQYRSLKKADKDFAIALVSAIIDANLAGRAQLEEAAASFRIQSVSEDGHADTDASQPENPRRVG